MTTPSPAPVPDGHGRSVPAMLWAVVRVVLDVLVIYIGAQVLLGVAVLGASSAGVAPEVLWALQLVASPIVLLGVALAWIGVRYQGGLELLRGRRPPSAAVVGVGIGFGIACFIGQLVIVAVMEVVASGLEVALPRPQEVFRTMAESPDTAMLLAATAVLLAPVAEEVLFRGVLFQRVRLQTGFWPAAVISAALFTLAHLGEGGGWLAGGVIAAVIFPLGLVFAALVERRGSLLVPIVAHAIYNAFGVTLLVLAPDVA